MIEPVKLVEPVIDDLGVLGDAGGAAEVLGMVMVATEATLGLLTRAVACGG